MDAADEPYLAELLRVLGESDTWATQMDPAARRLEPAPGSPLRGDDRHAEPYQVSHAAWHFLSHAVDHLACLRVLLADAKVIHLFAPFSLVRGALENACAVVWILQPSSRPDRVERRLRLALSDIRNGEDVKDLLGQQGPRSEQQRIEQVQAIAQGAGLGEAAIKRVTYTDIVGAVDEASGLTGKPIYLTWKFCSAIAHGDSWPTWAGMQRVELPGAPKGVGAFKIEADIKLLMYVTSIAAALTRQGWQLYNRRCTPPPAPQISISGSASRSAS